MEIFKFPYSFSAVVRELRTNLRGFKYPWSWFEVGCRYPVIYVAENDNIVNIFTGE